MFVVCLMSGLLSATVKLHDVTNSVTEIPEVGVQLSEWQVTVHFYVWQYVDVGGGDGCTRYSLTQHWMNLRVFSKGTLRNKQQQNEWTFTYVV